MITCPTWIIFLMIILRFLVLLPLVWLWGELGP